MNEHLEKIRAERYARACATPSDINEHMPLLNALARRCRHVTEFGRGHGNSTLAFIHAQPEWFVSYEINPLPGDANLEAMAGRTAVSLLRGDTRKVEIDYTDLLFVDTKHTYEQVRAELREANDRVRSLVVFHDTVTFGVQGDDGPGSRGILPAIEEFVAGGRFEVICNLENNNGLMVLRRKVVATWPNSG